MDNLSALSTLYKTTPVATDAVVRTRYGQSDDNGFASVLEAAKNLITETNSAQVNAQNEEIMRPLVELYLEPGGFFRTMHGRVTAPSC